MAGPLLEPATRPIHVLYAGRAKRFCLAALFSFFFRTEVRTLNTTLIIVLITALVIAVIALVREVRLRRALQVLLRRLLLLHFLKTLDN